MIKKVKLLRGQILTKDNILDILKTARSGYDFAKFTFYNNTYISIEFHRDYTVDVMTNSRDLMLWTEIEALRRIMYRPDTTAEFLFRWIRKLNC